MKNHLYSLVVLSSLAFTAACSHTSPQATDPAPQSPTASSQPDPKLVEKIIATLADGAPGSGKSSVIPAVREYPVNEAISPCENFYEYACSKVNSSFQLREDRSKHVFSFSDSHERLLDYKKTYFLNLAKAKPESHRESALKNYYQACMNPESRAQEEKALVLDAVKKIQGLKTREELLDFFQKQIMDGHTAPISFGTISNQDTPDMNDLYLDTSLMTFPERSYYQNEEMVKDLETLITHFFETIQLDRANERAKMIVDFEKGLALVYPTPQDFRVLVASRTKVTKEKLIKDFPHLKLSSFLARIPDKTLIRDFMPDSFKYLEKKFADLSEDDLRSLYLFSALSGELDDAYPKFFQEGFDFKKKHLGGPAVRRERQERCTTTMMSHFDKELDSILWTRLFPNFPTERVVKLSEKIRASILGSLDENKWLTAQAKKSAIQKIRKAKLQLVAPKTPAEWDFLPLGEYSPSLPIQNSLTYTKLVRAKDLKELRHKVSRDRWSMGPLTVNAYYSPAYNKFVLPVGILQPPFFDVRLPDTSNLAAMGTVIGHELGHGIDDKGSKYDANGRLKDWMTPHDLGEFKKRGSALIEQFARLGHNGELTLGENIGDLVGLSASYKAAFGGRSKFDAKEKQNFFLQYTRVWCEVQRPKYAELRLKTDPHALGFARGNEPMKHVNGFYEAFACKEGNAMYLPPEKRVQVW